MFQLWKLVLLCGLLTGTSASLLGGPGGLGLLGNLGNGVLGTGKEPQVAQLAGQTLNQVSDPTKNRISDALSTMGSGLGLKISNVKILAFTTEPTPDGKGTNLRSPITADVEANVPLLGKVVKLSISIDLMSGVGFKTTESGESIVVLKTCDKDPASIKLTLLEGKIPLTNNIVDYMTNFLSETLSFLVKNAVCPLLQDIVVQLKVTSILDLVNRLQNKLPSVI